MRYILAIIMILSAASLKAEMYNVGFLNARTQVVGADVQIRVFYPTQDQERQTDFGPWVLTVAQDATPAAGSFPLIVISHGLGGTGWNHHLLGQDLARRGYVVAAIDHPDDLSRVGRQAILDLRPMEITRMIDHVLADDDIGAVIDQDRIGAFGYSQGGLTILRSLGAQATHDTLIRHCAENTAQDEEFCTGKSAGFWGRIGILWRKLTYGVPDYDINAPVADPRIKVAVLAAPVGAPVTDLSAVTVPVWIIRAGADQVLTHPFHAEAIHINLAKSHAYTVQDGIDHYAFLSPFPDSIKDDVGLPAQDPPGFDRAAFHGTMNTQFIEYFDQHLSD
ncbi:MAG: hypothetical protein AAF386_02065 [Pseudomonadota bacterium]